MDEQTREALLKKRAELQRKLREEEERRLFTEHMRLLQRHVAEKSQRAILHLRSKASVIVDISDALEPSKALELAERIVQFARHGGARCGFAPLAKAEAILKRISQVLESSHCEKICYLYPGLSADSAVLQLGADVIAPHTVALWSDGWIDFVVTSADLGSGVSIEKDRQPSDPAHALECRYWGAFSLEDITVPPRTAGE